MAGQPGTPHVDPGGLAPSPALPATLGRTAQPPCAYLCPWLRIHELRLLPSWVTG